MSFPNRRNNNDEKNRTGTFSKGDGNGKDVDKITAEGVFQSFLLLAQEKFSTADNVNRLDKIYNQSPEYKAEKDKLMSVNNSDNSLVKGIALGMGSFLVLRRGPRIISRWLLQRQLSSKSSSNSHRKSYEFDKSFSINNKDPFQTATNKTMPQPEKNMERPGLLFRSIKFGVDMFVSLSMAAYGAIIFTNTEKMIQEVADIPLVEGRSLISDELCGDFYEQYRHYPSEIFEKKDDALLQAISRFVRNCRKRQVHENQIQQQEHGWDTPTNDNQQQQHVSIPSPGVPRAINIEIDWVNSYGKMIQNKKHDDNQESFMFDTEMEKENINEYDIRSTEDFTIEECDVDITNEIDFENDKIMNENNDSKK